MNAIYTGEPTTNDTEVPKNSGLTTRARQDTRMFRCDALAPDVHHRPRRRHEIRLADVVPFFFLLHHAADEIGQFFVAAPRRICACRSWSHTENRQVRILPSLVMRMRLQCPQKGCDTGAMIPISPTPSSKR